MADGHGWSESDPVKAVSDWFARPAMRELIESFDEPWPDAADLNGLVDGVAALTAKLFDFRGAAAKAAGQTERVFRWLAGTADLDDDRRAHLVSLASQLDLVDSTVPSASAYDAALVLGGGRASPRIRPKYTAELIRRFDLDIPAVYLLGSPREVDERKRSPEEPSERDIIEEYAPGAETEFDLMCRGGEAAFGLRPHDYLELRGSVEDANLKYRDWIVRRYADTAGPVAVALSAPASEPERLPNTADTFRFLMRYVNARPASRVLVVTTQVFVPFQFFDALRTLALPFCIGVEAVGYGRDVSGVQMTAEYALQEVNSGVRSAQKLLRALGGNSV